MGLLRPSCVCGKVTDISEALLRRLEIKGILLDVDNTLTSYSSKEPAEGTVEWAAALREKGYRIYIVSNNFRERVEPMARRYGFQFISFAMKPLPVGFLRAKGQLGVKSRNCLVVGDQIFTDILGANLCGMRSVLLEPIELEPGASFRVRRKLERPLRKKFGALK